MLRKAILPATSITLVAVVAITLRILCWKENSTAGFLTLKFDLTGELLDQRSPFSPNLFRRDLLQDIQNVQNGANSIVGLAATRVADATGQVQSAINSATSSLAEFDDALPQSCSLGTKQFCVGYKHSDKNPPACRDLPLNLSSLMPHAMNSLPEPVKAKLDQLVDSLAPLAESATSFPTSYLLNTLIAGLLLTIPITAFAVSLALGQPAVIANKLRNYSIRQRILIHAILGAACCFPFLLLTPLLFMTIGKPKQSPSWVTVERGEVPGLGFGALGCAVCLAACLASLPAANQPRRKDDVGRG